MLDQLDFPHAVVVELREARQAPGDGGRRRRAAGGRLGVASQRLDPGVDVVTAGGEGMQPFGLAFGGPCLQITEIGLGGGVWVGDEEGGGQAPERVGVGRPFGQPGQGLGLPRNSSAVPGDDPGQSRHPGRLQPAHGLLSLPPQTVGRVRQNRLPTRR